MMSLVGMLIIASIPKFGYRRLGLTLAQRPLKNERNDLTNLIGECDMSVIDEFLANNEVYASQFTKGSLPMPPAKQIAIVVCMDARLETGALLRLVEGDAHVIRNAGGVVTDDVIRSLTISQRLLGTREIMLIHHTDCGMLTFSDDDLKQQILDETGIKPTFAMEAFGDLDADLRQSITRVKASPYIPHKDQVRGFVYEVESGQLREVT
jgi:carbonic anhydrase